jgi:hypothetical protein
MNVMRWALKGLVLSAVGLAAAPTVVSAQKPAVQDQRPGGWIFTPSIAFAGSWDDNILLANPNETPQSDYGTPINPGATIDFYSRRTQFLGAYSGSFLRYHTLSALNSSSQDIRAALQRRATPRLTWFADEYFTRAPTTDALKVAGLPFYRVGSQMNAAGGGLDAALARHTSLHAGYTLRSVEFEADPRVPQPLEGGHAHEVRVDLTQNLSPRLTVGGRYEGTRGVFAQDLDRFQIHTAGGTAEYEVSPGLVVSGLLGLSLSSDPTAMERTGLAMRFGIMRRDRHASYQGGYERSFIPSFGFGGTFQNEQVTGSVHVPFGLGRAFVDATVGWSNNQALDATQPDLRTVVLSPRFGYYATRWLRIEGFYDRIRQNTQRAGGDLQRNQVGVRLVAAKPVKLR